MFCKKCGTEIPNPVKYCHHCGAELFERSIENHKEILPQKNNNLKIGVVIFAVICYLFTMLMINKKSKRIKSYKVRTHQMESFEDNIRRNTNIAQEINARWTEQCLRARELEKMRWDTPMDDYIKQRHALIGMTPEETLRLSTWGQPVYIEKKEIESGFSELWVYNDGSSLYFEEDKEGTLLLKVINVK